MILIAAPARPIEAAIGLGFSLLTLIQHSKERLPVLRRQNAVIICHAKIHVLYAVYKSAIILGTLYHQQIVIEVPTLIAGFEKAALA
jgi:hypothetical protein